MKPTEVPMRAILKMVKASRTTESPWLGTSRHVGKEFFNAQLVRSFDYDHEYPLHNGAFTSNRTVWLPARPLPETPWTTTE